MARCLTVAGLAVLALLLAMVLLAVPSELPGFTQRAEYTNPAIRWDFAEPSVLKADDGFYYAYSTENLTIERLAYIQAARSRDLVNWELLPDAMPDKPAWAHTTRDFWAPGVIEADGRTEAPKRPMLLDPIAYRSGWPKIEEKTPSTREREGPLVR